MMNFSPESVNHRFITYSDFVTMVLRHANEQMEMRIPLIPATDSGGRRPPVPEQGGRFLSERSDAGFS
jgi:hypothetical protein